FYLFYLEDFLAVFAAILICVATVRLWKFLRFGMFFKILERTLARSFVPLLSVTFAFSLVMVTFAMTILSLCGNNFRHVSGVMKATELLLLMSLESSDVALSEFS